MNFQLCHLNLEIRRALASINPAGHLRILHQSLTVRTLSLRGMIQNKASPLLKGAINHMSPSFASHTRRTASHFTGIPLAPPDAIVGLNDSFKGKLCTMRKKSTNIYL